MKKSYSAFLPAIFFTLLTASPFAAFSQTNEKSQSQTRSIRTKVVSYAKSILAKPYEKGKRGSESFDEAGFINYCYASAAEFFVPVTVRALHNYASIVPQEDREIADLIFFQQESAPTDVGIYIGNGEFITCTKTNEINSVATFNLNDSPWKERYFATGKLLDESGMYETDEVYGETEEEKANRSKTGIKNRAENADEEQDVNTIAQNPFVDKIFFSNFVTGDWSLFTENRFMINFRGISAQSLINYKAQNLTFGTGFMLRWNHGVGAFQMPLLLSVNILDFIKVYSGPVFTIGNCYTPISKMPVEASIFPGILGITFYLPSITKGDFKIQFIQDINFSIFNHADGSALPIEQTLTSGLELSTGISVTFPLSIFIK